MKWKKAACCLALSGWCYVANASPCQAPSVEIAKLNLTHTSTALACVLVIPEGEFCTVDPLQQPSPVTIDIPLCARASDRVAIGNYDVQVDLAWDGERFSHSVPIKVSLVKGTQKLTFSIHKNEDVTTITFPTGVHQNLLSMTGPILQSQWPGRRVIADYEVLLNSVTSSGDL